MKLKMQAKNKEAEQKANAYQRAFKDAFDKLCEFLIQSILQQASNEEYDYFGAYQTALNDNIKISTALDAFREDKSIFPTTAQAKAAKEINTLRNRSIYYSAYPNTKESPFANVFKNAIPVLVYKLIDDDQKLINEKNGNFHRLFNAEVDGNKIMIQGESGNTKTFITAVLDYENQKINVIHQYGTQTFQFDSIAAICNDAKLITKDYSSMGKPSQSGGKLRNYYADTLTDLQQNLESAKADNNKDAIKAYTALIQGKNYEFKDEKEKQIFIQQQLKAREQDIEWLTKQAIEAHKKGLNEYQFGEVLREIPIDELPERYQNILDKKGINIKLIQNDLEAIGYDGLYDFYEKKNPKYREAKTLPINFDEPMKVQMKPKDMKKVEESSKPKDNKPKDEPLTIEEYQQKYPNLKLYAVKLYSKGKITREGTEWAYNKEQAIQRYKNNLEENIQYDKVTSAETKPIPIQYYYLEQIIDRVGIDYLPKDTNPEKEPMKVQMKPKTEPKKVEVKEQVQSMPNLSKKFSHTLEDYFEQNKFSNLLKGLDEEKKEDYYDDFVDFAKRLAKSKNLIVKIDGGIANFYEEKNEPKQEKQLQKEPMKAESKKVNKTKAEDFSISDTLELIKKQTGLELDLSDNFEGIKKRNGKKYFNVVLPQRISESREYDILKRFADKYKLISVEPNGFKQVAIFQGINNKQVPAEVLADYPELQPKEKEPMKRQKANQVKTKLDTKAKDKKNQGLDYQQKFELIGNIDTNYFNVNDRNQDIKSFIKSVINNIEKLESKGLSENQIENRIGDQIEQALSDYRYFLQKEDFEVNEKEFIRKYEAYIQNYLTEEDWQDYLENYKPILDEYPDLMNQAAKGKEEKPKEPKSDTDYLNKKLKAVNILLEDAEGEEKEFLNKKKKAILILLED